MLCAVIWFNSRFDEVYRSKHHGTKCSKMEICECSGHKHLILEPSALYVYTLFMDFEIQCLILFEGEYMDLGQRPLFLATVQPASAIDLLMRRLAALIDNTTQYQNF